MFVVFSVAFTLAAAELTLPPTPFGTDLNGMTHASYMGNFSGSLKELGQKLLQEEYEKDLAGDPLDQLVVDTHYAKITACNQQALSPRNETAECNSPDVVKCMAEVKAAYEQWQFTWGRFNESAEKIELMKEELETYRWMTLTGQHCTYSMKQIDLSVNTDYATALGWLKEELTKDFRAKVHVHNVTAAGETNSTTGELLREDWGWAYKYELYQNKSADLQKQVELHAEIEANMTSEKADYDTKNAACQTTKNTYRACVCELRGANKATCANYAECFSNATTEFNNVIPSIREADEARALYSGKLGTVLCAAAPDGIIWSGVTSGPVFDEAMACFQRMRDAPCNVTHIPEIPAMVNCHAASNWMCTGEYLPMDDTSWIGGIFEFNDPPAGILTLMKNAMDARNAASEDSEGGENGGGLVELGSPLSWFEPAVSNTVLAGYLQDDKDNCWMDQAGMWEVETDSVADCILQAEVNGNCNEHSPCYFIRNDAAKAGESNCWFTPLSTRPQRGSCSSIPTMNWWPNGDYTSFTPCTENGYKQC